MFPSQTRNSVIKKTLPFAQKVEKHPECTGLLVTPRPPLCCHVVIGSNPPAALLLYES